MHLRPRVVELATVINDAVTKIAQIISEQGAAWPSFSEGAPVSHPKEADELKEAILDATAELHDLLLDPMSLIYKAATRYHLSSLEFIGRFEIASMVPAGGSISYGDIAQKTGMNEQMTRRLVRHAMTMRIFHEPEPGMVAHTQASKLLQSLEVNAFMRFHPDIGWPTSVKMIDALKKWPGSQEPNETAFSLANNENISIYDVFTREPERALDFASGMRAFGSLSKFHIDRVVEAYDWESLGQATLVDVGGSQGGLAIAVAKEHRKLRFIVQDMAKVVEGAHAAVPADFQNRISFMAHDFFTLQTVTADVYILRTVLHNWADKYCVIILRSLVPALQPGARILINDICLPKPGSMPAHRERDLRCMDLSMGALFNAQERDLLEWKALLAQADSRFVLQRVIQSDRSALAIIEVVWKVQGAEGAS
ncbi:S-adenosyl-L-methionine-dependent methyltransferase [Xylaria scruposa]|nr:S-adenosyl-L-methionine-dependent methyltransferase [Xylaria scruposa]